jgi:hypothetical protein
MTDIWTGCVVGEACESVVVVTVSRATGWRLMAKDLRSRVVDSRLLLM